MIHYLNKVKLSYYIRELGLSPQASIELQHDMMSLRFHLQREREILKKELKDEILKEISVQVNSGDALKEINGLQEAINQLKGGN